MYATRTSKCQQSDKGGDALSDHHVFRSMKHSLAEKHSKNNDEVKKWVDEYFASQPAKFFYRGIHSMRERWHEVVNNNDEYFLD
ncbi:unnamed protein product [Caenorhabditis nigoni]